MKSYSVYFVKDQDIELLKKKFGKAEAIAGSLWIMCGFCKDDELPEEEVLSGEESITLAISKELGEILFVYGDTSQDWFVYEHSCDGEMLRKLVWYQLPDDDCSCGWVCTEGNSEPWEATLFRAEMLDQFINREYKSFGDEDRLDDFLRYEKEIRTNWATGRIIAGKKYPECDGSVGLLVERSYGIERVW